MKNLAVFIISIVSVMIGSCTVLLSSNYSQNVNATVDYSKYSNVTNGLTFEYPSSWVIEYVEANGPEVLVTNPDRHNGIIIGLPGEYSQSYLTDYPNLIDAATDVFGKMYGVTIIEPFAEKIVNGLPSVMGKLSGDVALENGIVKQISQMALINHLGKIYSFQYYDIDSMFNSTESHTDMNRFILTFDISENHASPSNESNQVLVYDNPEIGYTLNYPANWLIEENRGEPTFTSPKLSTSDKAPESIAVTSEVLFPRITLEEYNDVGMSQLRSSLSNIKLIESSDTNLAGYPAHKILYTYMLESLELKNMQIWTVAGDKAYVLTYGAIPEEFDDSLPVFQDMMDSFKIAANQ